MPKKKLTKKNYPATCGAYTEFTFPKSQKKLKKVEKTDFEPLPKAQISLSLKMKYTTDLRIFFSTK
jgi:hypothetical protein